ncbi:MAG: FHA domain-containing protein [Myxococcaceae bacterium]|nr:FHA domain-containing protein [Myxococcaceae bacterium]
MARPSYMLSFLGIQEVRLGAQRFDEKFEGAFLVWEPGNWLPPSKGLVQTVGPSGDPLAPKRPTQTDALCFHLGAEPGVVITVGRAPENDCIVSDATVGRSHLLLTNEPRGWTVRAVGGRPVQVLGVALRQVANLRPGDTLQIGNVALTFGDAALIRSRTSSG